LRRRSSSDSWLNRRSASSCPAPVRPRAVLLGLFLALLVLASSAVGPLHEELDIAGITIAGNSRIDKESILNTFRLEPGRVYPYAEVRQGLERIYAMGFFDDVRLYIEDAAKGQIVTIEVVERPVVTSVRSTGHTKLDKDDIKAKIAIAVGSSLDPRLVEESTRAIKALYLEKGYYVASVTPEVEITTPGLAAVTFDIFEGAKVKIGRVRVDGNRLVGEGTIKKALESKDDTWYRRAKDFSPEKFDADMDKILRVYADRGFVRAKVVSHEAAIDRARNVADLDVVVEEGPQIIVRKIDVEVTDLGTYEGKVSRDALMESLRLLPGEPYGRAELEKSLDAMYSVLGDQGYVFAEIEPVEDVQGDSLDLTLQVNPHQAVRVGRVIIEGNQTTFDKVVRREIMIRPGDILRRSLVERSHRDIFNLGYFEDVEVGSKVANEQGDIDLIFKVKERQSGIFNIGTSYSAEFGLTGFVEFSHNNVGWSRRAPYLTLGKGESLNLKWEFGRLTQIELGYRNPWFRDRPMLLGWDIYDTRREYDTYTDKRDGFGLVVGRRVPLIDYSKAYLRYSLERRELDPDESKASDYVKSQAGKRTTSRVTLTLVRSSIDNPFFPRDGSRTTASAEWAGGWLRGTTAYQSYSVESANYVAVPLINSALVFRINTGLVDELGASGYIPVYERFRLGGTTSQGLRGYDDYEVIPGGNAADEGGRFMMSGSVEYRIPVIKNQAFLRGFLDAGNTWNSLRGARPWLLKRSAGFGFMIEIPMVGQIGLDVGYGFDREAEDGGPGWKSHFQFGMSGL
jgi:outer membrane protein insertion porin family